MSTGISNFTTTFVAGPKRGIIVVKAGDSTIGCVPSPKEQRALKRKFEKALKDAGRDDVVIVVPYHTQIELLEPPRAAPINIYPSQVAAAPMMPQFPPLMPPLNPYPQIVPVGPLNPIAPWGEIICGPDGLINPNGGLTSSGQL